MSGSKGCTLPSGWVEPRRFTEGKRLLLVLLWNTGDAPKRLPAKGQSAQ